jgi:putative transposase
LSVCRYVERNALSAGLVERAEEWQYGSLWAKMHGTKSDKELLTDWPVDRPRNWVELVNSPQTSKEIEGMKPSLERGRPFGNAEWVLRMAARLKAEHTLRPKGRPGKKKEGKSDGSEKK